MVWLGPTYSYSYCDNGCVVVDEHGSVQYVSTCPIHAPGPEYAGPLNTTAHTAGAVQGHRRVNTDASHVAWVVTDESEHARALREEFGMRSPSPQTTYRLFGESDTTAATVLQRMKDQVEHDFQGILLGGVWSAPGAHMTHEAQTKAWLAHLGFTDFMFTTDQLMREMRRCRHRF